MLNTSTISLLIFITIILATIVIIKNPQLSRGISIGIITALMLGVFIVNVSKNTVKNVIVITFSLGLVFSITTSYNHAIDEKKHFITQYPRHISISRPNMGVTAIA